MKRYLALPILLTLIVLALVIFNATYAQDGDQLAPDGTPRETYYAPFPLAITLDGELSDWQGVPKVTIPVGSDPSTGSPALTFAGAADGENLYFMADVIDNNIISGQHEQNYWNEDSVEFYVNATGNLGLTQYEDGVAQVTIPALNIDLSSEEAVIAGVRGDTVGAKIAAVKTDTGYAVELALPLKNDVWEIIPSHGETLGFQVHLNGASEADRDTKLIWSIFDTADQSYLNPSVFGKLIFFEIGQSEIPAAEIPTPTPTPIPVEADAPYKDPTLPVDERVEDLLGRMTLDEKIGQMTLVEKDSIVPQDITYKYIGGLLSGGGGTPAQNTPEAWVDMVNGFQEYALDTRLGIPIIYGIDAVHGNNNVKGAVIFPHNIGLGAANDPDLMTRIGRITAEEMIGTSIRWNYAPVVAVPQDIRWGRTYEGYSENTERVTSLGIAYLIGLQGEDLSDPLSVLGTPKHYVGDGGTVWGTSTTGDYKIDQGVTDIDEATLRAIHLPPYQAAVEAGTKSIMISFSSWGGIKMHGQQYLITDVLKGELGFEGFIVSDWGGIDQIDPDYYTSVVTAVNAGVDMNMVPYNYNLFISTMQKAVENGDISMERIDDAVRRILRVKFEMGLFENPFPSTEELLAQVGSDEHRAIAREAVSKSLVLLKNEHEALPLAKDTPVIFVAGAAADDIGTQSGGWTISWQGSAGDITPGTTILQAIQATVSENTTVEYSPRGRFEGNADACIAVVGEKPYAEGVGDAADLNLQGAQVTMLNNMREQCGKLIVVLISGRPMIVTDAIENWDAFVAAWLPGTEGQGVADVLFGDQPFTGTLPYTWPRSMDQLPTPGDEALFPYGYGIQTAVE